MDDLIKIGHTVRLASRRRELGIPWSHVLALHPGTRAEEHALHATLAEHVARGCEWYRPVPPIFDLIDELREQMGLGPVLRW